MTSFEQTPTPIAASSVETKFGSMPLVSGFDETMAGPFIKVWFGWLEVPGSDGLHVRLTADYGRDLKNLSRHLEFKREAEDHYEPYVSALVAIDGMEVLNMLSGDGKGGFGTDDWKARLVDEARKLLDADADLLERAQTAVEDVQALAWRNYATSLRENAAALLARADEIDERHPPEEASAPGMGR